MCESLPAEREGEGRGAEEGSPTFSTSYCNLKAVSCAKVRASVRRLPPIRAPQGALVQLFLKNSELLFTLLCLYKGRARRMCVCAKRAHFPATSRNLFSLFVKKKKNSLKQHFCDALFWCWTGSGSGACLWGGGVSALLAPSPWKLSQTKPPRAVGRRGGSGRARDVRCWSRVRSNLAMMQRKVWTEGELESCGELFFLCSVH